MKNSLEKVIITGGAGFIGSNLAEHLFQNGTKKIETFMQLHQGLR